MTKTLLFDLDGVLTLPEEVFSVIYSRSHGYDLTPFTEFFETEWADFVTGEKDLNNISRIIHNFGSGIKAPMSFLIFGLNQRM